ncbi:hypothetical protein IM660_03415 [Ruania alkalisoli]|uniref:Uncharacterized protein n=1 Tax=Ruania alkalisoli TaxID=2779775 RepID=A0A7M1SV53_9MICO|nr:hypothetical protein [Ruania alkalisoli]QOR71361.1 hypothetical protein IM660_03415 [Ruania alkalisoli]
MYESVLRAKSEQRAVFPLGGPHLWEVAKIADPKERRRLAEVMEEFSDFNYLPGRRTVAELEFAAGIARVMGEQPRLEAISLLRPTFGHVFGM